MDTRRLLSVTVLYGAADVAVMAVGGFLLLPLYTRTLTQAEFGTYVAVKANVEIFTYLVCLGLPSAVSRVYFDHRQAGQQVAYISSVLLFFALCLAVLLAGMAAWGAQFWSLLSPTTPASPYLAFSIGLAAFWQVNLVWGVLNWLPIRPLDGGHIFSGFLEGSLGPKRGSRVANVVFPVFTAAAGWYAWRQGLVFAAFLAGFVLLSEVQRFGAGRRPPPQQAPPERFLFEDTGGDGDGG